ncbi:MAG: RNA pseudouridine synthase [Candidatus Omnitrophica bacterium CG11_big_fil_rev_8_21_14_0_20_45_26]|uniref:Pseudouridine synthase n=1 Tax=Candidatus Abzuiibacterium crystallinum TaxID=1974748 RepID=A0A2H0LQ36_9BACT|nr:MAG: RNA pseudouridine synthase [Candidatus Omnitrophica bacterium CG11_big_fil_rev_8_21_14_0_20_45_26]PIW64190.1 MAG: RNA pseudouridine synthase [Candidatus Omnitrophica bacterium CG12_big_fil_rev_8_21_14_0_65_45_16]
MPTEKRIVPPEAAGKRLDQFLADQFGNQYSRTKLKEMILAGRVSVDGVNVKPHFQISPGQSIVADLLVPVVEQAIPEDIDLNIVYEDDDLVVVDKPVGMVVHPAAGHDSGTLVNALLHHIKKLSKVGGELRAGIIHRLDKDTTGLMLVAKNDRAHEILARQFERHTVEKTYWTVVRGVVAHDEMRSEEPLGRSPTNRKKVIVRMDEIGKASLTNFKVLERFPIATLVEAKPKTGRTHQIRVHLRHLGYPILGDKEYGIQTHFIARQALHAKEIAFLHPSTQKRMKIESELPEDMKNLLRALQTAKTL